MGAFLCLKEASTIMNFGLGVYKAVLQRKSSVRSIERANGIDYSNLRLWIRFYEHYGKAELKSFLSSAQLSTIKSRL